MVVDIMYDLDQLNHLQKTSVRVFHVLTYTIILYKNKVGNILLIKNNVKLKHRLISSFTSSSIYHVTHIRLHYACLLTSYVSKQVKHRN